MSEKKSNSPSRYRNYATIIYPESAPENWRDILTEFQVPIFVSPLHDKDVNPDGSPKKPHYHVQFIFDGVKTKEQVQALANQINGVGLKVLNSLRGYARYLCHLDNPEKYQYNIDEITSFCGADYLEVIGLPSDKYKCIREILQWIEDNDCDAFCDLLTYCSMFHEDWFRVLCDNSTYVVKEYLTSRTWKKEHGQEADFSAQAVGRR